MISSFSRASLFCRFSSLISSLASISSFTRADAVVKPTVSPFWQAASPSPSAMCVLPVPLLPMAMTFSRLSMYSQRASCVTSCLFTDGMAGKSKASRLLIGGEARCLDPASHQAVMSVYELQFRQPQQVVRIVHALRGALRRDLAVLPQEGRQLQLLQVMFQQQCRSVTHDAFSLSSFM